MDILKKTPYAYGLNVHVGFKEIVRVSLAVKATNKDFFNVDKCLCLLNTFYEFNIYFNGFNVF